jgi:hypothetical protein
MAKRVAQLYEAHCAIAEELDKLMPQQYRQPTNDSLGRTWQTAVNTLAACKDYFSDLTCFLEFKAEKAEERAALSVAVVAPKADTV